MTTPTATPPATYQPDTALDQVRRDLDTALAALRERGDRIAKRWRYYDGDHPQLWLTERFRRAFGNLFQGQLADNYCQLAVDAVVSRLQVTGWEPREETALEEAAEDGTEPADAGDAAMACWLDNNLDLDQEELWRAAQAAGEAYLIVWPRTDEQGQAVTGRRGAPLYDVVVNDARNVYLHTSPSGRERRWAAKVWKDADAKCWRATLYYPTEVVRLRTRDLNTGSSTGPAKASAFMLDPADSGGATPFSKPGVCVFRFAADRKGRSRLDRLMAVQDKLNKLSANKMVAAEFMAWPQRYVLGGGDIPDDALRPSPGAFLQLDPGGNTEDGDAAPTKVGEFSAAQLSNYDGAYQAELDKLFTLAPLPRHLMVNPGADPSGAAITADEGPFVAVVTDAAQMYGGSLADVMELLGYDAVPQWADAEVANGEGTARELLLLTQAGVPVEAALRMVNRADDATMAAVGEAQARAAAAQAAAAQLAATALSQGVDPAEVAARDAGTA